MRYTGIRKRGFNSGRFLKVCSIETYRDWQQMSRAPHCSTKYTQSNRSEHGYYVVPVYVVMCFSEYEYGSEDRPFYCVLWRFFVLVVMEDSSFDLVMVNIKRL